MFELKSITLQNFLSFGRSVTMIDFTEANSWLLFGTNGSGKSAIIEAIHFALYGTPYRNAKVDDVVNRVNKEASVVTVKFNNGGNTYTIERGIKPKYLKVIENGQPMQETVSKRDFQKTIDEIIGVPYNVFSQLTIIDSTFYTPFMELDKSARRQLIDRVFGLDQITKMLEIGRDKKSKIGTKIVESKGAVELVKEKIRLNEQYAIAALDKEISNKEGDILRLSDELKVIVERSLDIVKELTWSDLQIKESNGQLDTLQKELSVLETRERELETAIRDHERHMRLLKAGKCKECGHTFENAEAELEDIKKKIAIDTGLLEVLRETEINPVNERCTMVESTLGGFKQQQDKLKAEGNLIAKQRGKIEAQIGVANEELDFLRKKKETGVVDVTALEAEMKAAQDTLVRDNYMLSQIQECEKILSEGGVRSYIMKKFLPVFNATLRKYLTQMEAGFVFTFNENFEDVMDDRYRNSFAYGNLSTGQRARVNFAIVFALIEFVEKKNNIKSDFIILDEALEGGLDVAGKEAVLNILQREVKKRLIVISHDEKLQEMFEKKLQVQIQGSFSKISEVQ